MFVEGGTGWKPPPWEPPRRGPRVTKRQELVILWLVGLNALLMLIAPLGGATLIEAVIAIFAKR